MEQVRGMADSPGALELRAELIAALSRRFVARTIKLIFGPQVRPSSLPLICQRLSGRFKMHSCIPPTPAELPYEFDIVEGKVHVFEALMGTGILHVLKECQECACFDSFPSYLAFSVSYL